MCLLLRVEVIQEFVEAAWARRRWRKLRINLSVQTKPEFRRQWAAATRAKRRLLGVCIACGLGPPMPERVRCWLCAALQNDARSRRRAHARSGRA